jgi:hypothetical protein
VEHRWQRGRSSRTPKPDQPSQASSRDAPSVRRRIKAKAARPGANGPTPHYFPGSQAPRAIDVQPGEHTTRMPLNQCGRKEGTTPHSHPSRCGRRAAP